MERLVEVCQGLQDDNSFGYWWEKMREGKVFTATNSSEEDLKACLEEYLPRILCDIPLPKAIAVPAIHPGTGQESLQIIYGEDFFEASYLFYESSLSVSPENFSWPTPNRFEEYRYPKHISWNNAGDDIQKAIFYTLIDVAVILPLDADYFTQEEVEQLRKINFGFNDVNSARLNAKSRKTQTQGNHAYKQQNKPLHEERQIYKQQNKPMHEERQADEQEDNVCLITHDIDKFVDSMDFPKRDFWEQAEELLEETDKQKIKKRR